MKTILASKRNKAIALILALALLFMAGYLAYIFITESNKAQAAILYDEPLDMSVEYKKEMARLEAIAKAEEQARLEAEAKAAAEEAARLAEEAKANTPQPSYSTPTPSPAPTPAKSYEEAFKEAYGVESSHTTGATFG